MNSPIIKDLPAANNKVVDMFALPSSPPATCKDTLTGLEPSRFVTLTYLASSKSIALSLVLVAVWNVATVVSELAGQVTILWYT